MTFYVTEETNNYFCIWPKVARVNVTKAVGAFFECKRWLVANFGKEGVKNGWIAEPMLGFRIYKWNQEKLLKFQLTWM